jgi:HK97 family phage major capsid protein
MSRSADEILAAHRRERDGQAAYSERVKWDGADRGNALQRAVDRRVAAQGAEIAHEEAFKSYLRFGLGPDLRDRHRETLIAHTGEHRDLSGGTNTAGGFTVPAAFQPTVTVALKSGSPMYRASRVLTTKDGAPLSWGTTDDTGTVGAILAENNTVSTQDITFGQKTLSAFPYNSKLVKVSQQLLTDAAFDFAPWLLDLLFQRVARAANAGFTNGTRGGTQPTGIVPNATVGVTGSTGSTTTATFANIADLVTSVNPAYLEPAVDDADVGFVGWMVAPATLGMLRKISDAAGSSIVVDGRPPVIMGYPVMVNPDMPTPAASARTILFGAFGKAYTIREARGRQLALRLDERYADAFQTGFIAAHAFDGVIDDAAAIRAFVHSAT